MSGRPAGVRREALWVAALATLPLLPFLGKAFSLDEPLYLAVAHQIVADPADPLGFRMFWDPTALDAFEFNRNPPFFSYYLAAFIAAFGEHEALLHAAVLPFPLIACLAFLGVARRLAPRPLGPVLLLATAPAFGVLAATLLLDVPVLACILCGVYTLLRARDDPAARARWEWLAGVATALAGLVKYVGFTAAPLVAAGGLLLLPRSGRTPLRLLTPPLLAWGLWGAWSAHLYGTPHWWSSAAVVGPSGDVPRFLATQLAELPVYQGLAQLFPIALLFAALRRGAPLAVAALVAGAALAVLVLPGGLPARRHPIELDEQLLAALGAAAALGVWAVTLRPRRARGEELFLVLWLAGTLVYAAFFNWHVKATDALLAAPPLLLLLFRSEGWRPSKPLVGMAAGAGLVLSLALNAADAVHTAATRDAARAIVAAVEGQPGRRRVASHWGLQHYLVREGFEPVLPLAFAPFDLAPGDWIAFARNSYGMDATLHLQRVELREVETWTRNTWLPLRLNNHAAGAGFYSHRIGYVPYALAKGPVEVVTLARVSAVRDAPRPRDPEAPAPLREGGLR